MASVDEIVLLEETITADTTGESKATESYQSNFIAVLDVTAINGGTVAGVVEHAPKAEGPWVTLATFAGITTVTADVQQISVNVLPHVRADLTYAGTTADAKVRLFYDKRK